MAHIGFRFSRNMLAVHSKVRYSDMEHDAIVPRWLLHHHDRSRSEFLLQSIVAAGAVWKLKDKLKLKLKLKLRRVMEPTAESEVIVHKTCMVVCASKVREVEGNIASHYPP